MVKCMKTTVEIADALLAETKQLAAAEETTVRAIIEEGLRHVVSSRSTRTAFTLPDKSFNGNGLQPDVAAGSWSDLRELIYEGRGG